MIKKMASEYWVQNVPMIRPMSSSMEGPFSHEEILNRIQSGVLTSRALISSSAEGPFISIAQTEFAEELVRARATISARRRTSLFPTPELLFSFSGRISRAEFWRAIVSFFLPVSLLANFLSFGLGLEAARTLALIISIAGLWPVAAVWLKRWHDFGRSGGWLATLMLIPFFNSVILIWVLGEMLFVKGTSGPNRYGDDPLPPLHVAQQGEIESSTTAPFQEPPTRRAARDEATVPPSLKLMARISASTFVGSIVIVFVGRSGSRDLAVASAVMLGFSVLCGFIFSLLGLVFMMGKESHGGFLCPHCRRTLPRVSVPAEGGVRFQCSHCGESVRTKARSPSS
jgi:uncharacterized membrane protein YhaH (DUF805 family)